MGVDDLSFEGGNHFFVFDDSILYCVRREVSSIINFNAQAWMYFCHVLNGSALGDASWVEESMDMKRWSAGKLSFALVGGNSIDQKEIHKKPYRRFIALSNFLATDKNERFSCKQRSGITTRVADHL